MVFSRQYCGKTGRQQIREIGRTLRRHPQTMSAPDSIQRGPIRKTNMSRGIEPVPMPAKKARFPRADIRQGQMNAPIGTQQCGHELDRTLYIGYMFQHKMRCDPIHRAGVILYKLC